jgi:hypothetical protein
VDGASLREQRRARTLEEECRRVVHVYPTISSHEWILRPVLFAVRGLQLCYHEVQAASSAHLTLEY